jgi:hypothetical protein
LLVDLSDIILNCVLKKHLEVVYKVDQCDADDERAPEEKFVVVRTAVNNNAIKMNTTNTNKNNGVASYHDNATIILFDAPSKRRRLHYVVFLGFF